MSTTRIIVTAILICLLVASAGCVTKGPPIEQSCRSPLDARVGNSCIVVDQVLWRGARPNRAAASALMEMGVRTIVNLELLHEDLPAFESAQFNGREAQEIQYFHLGDWEPLVAIAPGVLDRHVAHFLAITESQPAPLFVHCRAGKNRTGVMVAAYRVHHGASIDEAIAEMQEYEGFWSNQDAAYIRTLTPERMTQMKRRISEWIPKLQRNALIVCADNECAASAERL